MSERQWCFPFFHRRTPSVWRCVRHPIAPREYDWWLLVFTRFCERCGKRFMGGFDMPGEVVRRDFPALWRQRNSNATGATR